MVMGQLHEIKKIFFYLHSQPYMYLPIKDGRLFNRGVQSFPLKKTTKSGPFRHFFEGAATHYSKGTKKKLSSPIPAIFEGGRGRGGDKNGTSSLACEQALLFGRVKRVSLKRVSERRSHEGQRKAPFPGPSRAFSRGSLHLPK